MLRLAFGMSVALERAEARVSEVFDGPLNDPPSSCVVRTTKPLTASGPASGVNRLHTGWDGFDDFNARMREYV